MSKRLLVVDDSPMVHAQMKGLLSDTEFKVVRCCQNAEDAISAYEELMPDVVTMDIGMPGRDGLEAAKEILARWKDARILMVSSLVYDEVVNEAAKMGAKGFVFKPFEKEHLVNALRYTLK